MMTSLSPIQIPLRWKNFLSKLAPMGFFPVRYEGMALIGGVIQDHGQGKIVKFCVNHSPQCGYRRGVNVAGVGECVIRDCRQRA